MPSCRKLELGRYWAGYPPFIVRQCIITAAQAFNYHDVLPYPSKFASFGFIPNPRLLYKDEMFTGIETLLPLKLSATFCGLNMTWAKVE